MEFSYNKFGIARSWEVSRVTLDKEILPFYEKPLSFTAFIFLLSGTYFKLVFSVFHVG